MTTQSTHPATAAQDQPAADDMLVQPLMAELFPPEEGFFFYPHDTPGTLVPDFDEERTLERQRELQAYLGEPIGVESKPEKRAGLAAQQYAIEVRHGLRLLLGYGDDLEGLLAHLERCLADADYGYGPNGDNGRTIAQGMVVDGALSRELASAWLELHAGLRQAILDGEPVTTLSVHDNSELITFVPLLQRVGEEVWRLGVEGEGKHRDFQGDIWQLWGSISQTMIEWYDADNEQWLAGIKAEAARLPDTIQRAAWGDRLRKDRHLARLEGTCVVLAPAPEPEDYAGMPDWPRFLFMPEQHVGLTRLSGHSYYELSWDAGLAARHFELSNTTRKHIPFEHTELAVRMAQVAAGGAQPDPAAPEEIEGAYLRRLFSPRAGQTPSVTLGPPQADGLPQGITDTAVATYQAGEVTVTLLHGGDLLACATAGETAVALRRDERRGVVAGLQLVRGRLERQPLMTTPLDELHVPPTPEEMRALCAWAAWMAQALKGKK